MIEYVRKWNFIHIIEKKKINKKTRRGLMGWIDMHCDTLSRIMKAEGSAQQEEKTGAQGTLMRNLLCVDIERLEKAGAEAQFFASFVDAASCTDRKEEEAEKGGRILLEEKIWDQAYKDVLRMLDHARQEECRRFRIARSAEDLEAANGTDDAGKDHPVIGILTVEEGGVLNGKAERLGELYDRGVRLLTLTWNYENGLGSPNSRDREVMARGLTAFGKEVVERMNEYGMLIDVSHLSDGGFWDCMRCSRMPVVASHSNCRTLCDHPRNLTDEMLRALGEKGGVAGLNFYSAFLCRRGRARPEDIARHARHIIDKGGEDAAALGTDFDGFEPEALPEGIRGVQDMEKIWEAMRGAGITPRQIDKIASENLRRVLEIPFPTPEQGENFRRRISRLEKRTKN